MWKRCKHWCRDLLFRINPVNGILLTVSVDELVPIGRTHPSKSDGRVYWANNFSKPLRSLSSNLVMVYSPEVEEYLESVGAVKMVNTDIGHYIYGGYTDDMTMLKARMEWFPQEVVVQGILFAHSSQAVDFKLRFL